MQITKEMPKSMKIKFHPFLKEARGRFGDVVFRLCHNGEWQMTDRPNMSKVKWSQAQLEQRERMAEATAYASCVKDRAKRHPELVEFYLQMAWEKKHNGRWFDMAVSDYYHNRINRMGRVCTSGSRSNGGQTWSDAGSAENEGPGGGVDRPDC
jgi:hypothetical protein